MIQCGICGTELDMNWREAGNGHTHGFESCSRRVTEKKLLSEHAEHEITRTGNQINRMIERRVSRIALLEAVLRQADEAFCYVECCNAHGHELPHDADCRVGKVRSAIADALGG